MARWIPAEAGIQEDAICYAVTAKSASPHRMRPSKSLFSKESLNYRVPYRTHIT
jgi:hypothetical protein